MKEGVEIVFPLPAFDVVVMDREIEEMSEIKRVGKQKLEIKSL